MLFLLHSMIVVFCLFFFFQAEDGIRDVAVTGVQTCALPISDGGSAARLAARGDSLFVLRRVLRLGHDRSSQGMNQLDFKGRTAIVTGGLQGIGDRKSTRLNSSHGYISYAVFCLKKKRRKKTS